MAGREISFLGYCFSRENVRLRKNVKQNFARKYKRVKSKRRKVEIRGSYKGWCKWGNCKNLYKKITNMGFKDKGVASKPALRDGKRFFDVENVRLMDVLNVPITVIDFESGIKTKQGEGRYSVLIEHEGMRKKFITNSFDIKATLDEARRMEQEENKKIFPVENVIARRKSTKEGHSIYYFN